MSFKVTDLGLLLRVAILEAIVAIKTSWESIKIHIITNDHAQNYPLTPQAGPLLWLLKLTLRGKHGHWLELIRDLIYMYMYHRWNLAR